jgi:hypothetical protein
LPRPWRKKACALAVESRLARSVQAKELKNSFPYKLKLGTDCFVLTPRVHKKRRRRSTRSWKPGGHGLTHWHTRRAESTHTNPGLGLPVARFARTKDVAICRSARQRPGASGEQPRGHRARGCRRRAAADCRVPRLGPAGRSAVDNGPLFSGAPMPTAAGGPCGMLTTLPSHADCRGVRTL